VDAPASPAHEGSNVVEDMLDTVSDRLRTYFGGLSSNAYLGFLTKQTLKALVQQYVRSFVANSVNIAEEREERWASRVEVCASLVFFSSPSFVFLEEEEWVKRDFSLILNVAFHILELG